MWLTCWSLSFQCLDTILFPQGLFFWLFITSILLSFFFFLQLNVHFSNIKTSEGTFMFILWISFSIFHIFYHHIIQLIYSKAILITLKISIVIKLVNAISTSPVCMLYLHNLNKLLICHVFEENHKILTRSATKRQHSQKVWQKKLWTEWFSLFCAKYE